MPGLYKVEGGAGGGKGNKSKLRQERYRKDKIVRIKQEINETLRKSF